MLVDSAVYINGVRSREVEPGSGFAWVGLLDPSTDEIEKYQQKFLLHPLAVEDAVMGRHRPKLDVYPLHSFLILKTVMFNKETSRIVVGDIGIFINEKVIVIVRHGDAIPMRSIRADLEKNPDRLEVGSTAVLHEVLDRLVVQQAVDGLLVSVRVLVIHFLADLHAPFGDAEGEQDVKGDRDQHDGHVLPAEQCNVPLEYEHDSAHEVP